MGLSMFLPFLFALVWVFFGGRHCFCLPFLFGVCLGVVSFFSAYVCLVFFGGSLLFVELVLACFFVGYLFV